MLKVRNLTLRAGGKSVFPLWKVDLELKAGERLAVVGESGGGKSSLAWALSGRPLPGQIVHSGSVSLGEIDDLLRLAPSERAGLYYRRIALVPQNAQNTFHPTQPLWKSVREIMRRRDTGTARLEGRTVGRRFTFSRNRSRSRVMEALEPFGEALDLPPSLWFNYPHQLSGGQKQRMALILALLNKPGVLLLDEPTNALDEITRERLMTFLDDWVSANHTGVVLFTHDMELAACWTTRMAVLYRGEIVEELPAAMFERSLHPYTQGLVRAGIRLGDPPFSRRSIPGHVLPLCGAPEGCGFVQRCFRAREACGKKSPRLRRRDEHKVRCLFGVST